MRIGNIWVKAAKRIAGTANRQPTVKRKLLTWAIGVGITALATKAGTKLADRIFRH